MEITIKLEVVLPIGTFEAEAIKKWREKNMSANICALLADNGIGYVFNINVLNK